MLYVSAFNYKDAQVLLDSSLRLAGEMRDFSTLSNCYNSIGNVELSLMDTNEARNNFKKSLQVAESHHLERQAGVTLGSLASIEKDQDSAKGMFSRAMSCLKKEAGTEEELSYILINLGNIGIVLMLAFMAYPLSFFGSNKPDRVIKAELLRFHRTQHERNLQTRQHGFDERILRVNRQANA